MAAEESTTPDLVALSRGSVGGSSAAMSPRAGSGSGSCGASDSDLPVATREIRCPNNQEEGCPSVGAVREYECANAGRDDATGNTRDPKGAEVAVLPRDDQALQAGSRGRRPPLAQTFRCGVVVGCVHRWRPAHARFRNPR